MRMALTALGLALIVWNTVVSVSVLRAGLYEGVQKALQIVLIWILPLIGPALVWYLLKEHRTERATTVLPDNLLGTGDYYRNDSAADGLGSAEGGADGGH